MFSVFSSALIIFKQAHFKCILIHSGAHNPRGKAFVFIAAHKISEHFLSPFLVALVFLKLFLHQRFFGKQCVHVLDHWSEYVFFPGVFRCWLLIQFLFSFYLLLCCLGSWDKVELHLSETVFVLVFYKRLCKNIFFFCSSPFYFFPSSLWFLFCCNRLSSGLEFVQEPAFCTLSSF